MEATDDFYDKTKKIQACHFTKLAIGGSWEVGISEQEFWGGDRTEALLDAGNTGDRVGCQAPLLPTPSSLTTG